MGLFEQGKKEVQESMDKALLQAMDLTGLEKVFQAHAKEIGKHAKELAPQVVNLWNELSQTLPRLSSEKDEAVRKALERKVGSLKRAHASLLKSVEIKAANAAAASIDEVWALVNRVTRAILALI